MGVLFIDKNFMRFAKKKTKYDGIGLGEKSDKKIANELGLNPSTVAAARYRRGIKASQKQRVWTKAEIDLLGTNTDTKIGAMVGRKKMAVYYARRSRKIPALKCEGDKK